MAILACFVSSRYLGIQPSLFPTRVAAHRFYPGVYPMGPHQRIRVDLLPNLQCATDGAQALTFSPAYYHPLSAIRMKHAASQLPHHIIHLFDGHCVALNLRP